MKTGFRRDAEAIGRPIAPEIKKSVGENAAQKIVRLLAKLEKELVQEGSGDALKVEVDAGGRGNLLICWESGHSYPLYGFSSLDQLTKYLECDQLHRLVASVTWEEVNF